MKNIDKILNGIDLNNVDIPEEIENKINYTINHLNSHKTTKYKFNEYFSIKKLVPILASIAVIILTTGVYATMKNAKNIEQKEGTIDQKATIFDNSDEYYDWVHDMDYDDNIYYKKITSYSEYLKIKKVWNDIVQMNESDFEENFFLILMSKENTYISKIYCNENTTFVEISYNNIENYSADKSRITTKISNELNREYLDIKINPNIDGISDCKNLEDFEKSYSKEEAISNGYFVLSNCEIISNDKDLLDKFIENSSTINSSIRIIIYSTYSDFKICDIVCKNGNYQMSLYCPETGITTFATGNKIIKSTVKYQGVFNEKWSYLLVDEGKWNEYGTEETIICATK